MDTEQLFLKTLNELAHYKIENDQLKLMTADKTVVMVCDYMTERE
jgi:heat shock protein HslJ